jgi:hypothetical protein
MTTERDRKLQLLRRVAIARLRLKAEKKLGMAHDEETLRIAALLPEAKAS